MALDDAGLAAVAAARHGVFGRADALRLGATSAQIRSRVANGRWDVLEPGVYGFPGHAPSWRRELWVAVLSGGPTSVVAFEAAGQHHTLAPLEPDPVTLIVDRPRRHASAGAVWHRLDDLRPHHVAEIDGLPITTIPRTIVDLAAVLRRGRYELLVEDAITRRLVTVAEAGRVLSEVRRRGKPGVMLAERTLDLLGPGEGLTRSELEKLLDEALRLAGLPEPTREHPLPSVQCMTGFVDRYYPEARWIIEADGRKWHDRRLQMAKDSERDTEAARCGFLTTRRMWEHLASDPRGCAEALADIYRGRVALIAGR